MSLVFVYGTLKRWFINAHHMSAAVFMGEAVTRDANYALAAIIDYDYPYPALCSGHGFVSGELYRVDDALLSFLDAFEGDEYERRTLLLTDKREAQAYFWRQDGAGLVVNHHQILYDLAQNIYTWQEG